MNKFTLFFMLFSLVTSVAFAQDEQVDEGFTRIGPILSEEKKQAYLNEAFDSYAACQQDENYYRAYDCKCIASEMYKVRIETGYFFDRASILEDSLLGCKDTPKMAGTHYNQCLSWSAAMRKNAVEFCECYGNIMAKNFDNGNLTNARAEEGIMSIAMTECNAAHPKDNKVAINKSEEKKESKFSSLFSIFEN